MKRQAMKVILTALLLAFCLHAGTVKAQMMISLHTEYPVTGPQHGAAIGMEFNKKWGGGVFYQSEIFSDVEGSEPHQLHGAFLTIPLVVEKKLMFYGKIRAAYADKQFFTVLPGLETRVAIREKFGVAFEMSMRMGYPSLSGKIYALIF